jgi:hypothetical protein
MESFGMPINGALREYAFAPEDITIIVAAFEDTLRHLKLEDRSDPLTTLVAKKMIEIAQAGERDPVRLRDQTLRVLRS